MADQQDIIIIRRGQIQVQRATLLPYEVEALDEIAAKGDMPLTNAEAFALAVILDRVARRP